MRAPPFRTAVILVAAGYLVPLAVVGGGVALLTGLDSGPVGVVARSIGAALAVAAGVGALLLALGLLVASRGIQAGDSRGRVRRLAWATLPGFCAAAALLYNVLPYNVLS